MESNLVESKDKPLEFKELKALDSYYVSEKLKVQFYNLFEIKIILFLSRI